VKRRRKKWFRWGNSVWLSVSKGRAAMATLEDRPRLSTGKWAVIRYYACFAYGEM
jgi:hypothetical protein